MTERQEKGWTCLKEKQPAGQIDFAEGSVRRKTLALAAPMLIAQVLNLLYNIVDRIYIGKIPGEGTAALAGLGLCFPVVTIVTAFANLFGASDATYPYAASYLTVYLLGTLCVMTSLGLNPYINCQGFAKIGMLTVVVGAAANIVLDPVLIFVLHLGVRGAAIATVISQMLSALWVLRFLTGRQAELKIGFRGFQPDFACIRRIATLGVSSFVMSFTDSLVQIACNATLLTFGGDIYISVMTVLNSVRQIAQTPVMAIADGATAVISFNYGAKAYSRVRGAIRFMTQLAFGYTALSWLLISLFPAAFIRIFNQDAAMLRAAIPSLHIYFFGFVMMAFQYSGQSTFKSLNRAGFAVFFSLLRKAFIVVPLTLVLPRVAGIGVNGVFAAEPISNLIGGLACYITMRCTVMRELEHRESMQCRQTKK